jgi:hypothetical protein
MRPGEIPVERQNTEQNAKLHTNCAEVRAKHTQCVRALSSERLPGRCSSNKNEITHRNRRRRVINF